MSSRCNGRAKPSKVKGGVFRDKGDTYILLVFCMFIKTSILSSISFCISFKREAETRITPF